jgi:hypothetical protein
LGGGSKNGKVKIDPSLSLEYWNVSLHAADLP